MIRKIGVLGISLLCFAAIVSCEKDFSDIGSSVVNNTKFETGEILLDVEIETIDISASNPNPLYKAVQADNINTSISDYWLGVYNNSNAKKLEASIVSQLAYVSGLKNAPTSGIDTIYNLDKVILKLPYPATIVSTSAGINTFKLDSILGDTNEATSILVKRNLTFLNILDPTDPSKQNSFQSNFPYQEGEVLNEDLAFSFTPKPKDTVYTYSRINRMNPSENYDEEVRTLNSQEQAVPFLAIPLDLTKMKTIFWDNFDGNEFSSKEEFDIHFKGLIIEALGDKGSLVPFNLASFPAPSVDFYYTKSIMEGLTTVVDTLNRKYSFPLSRIRNSIYKTSPATIPAPVNNFTIQGTAGTMAKIKILDDTKLQELRTNNWLINDALFTFHINENINTDKNIVPQRLFLYQDKENEDGSFSPTQLTDAYKESATFGGFIQLSSDDKPEKYNFRITDYISDLLDGTTSDISPLVLKIYNSPTDNAVNNNALKTSVSTYNWNPRGVTLLDGNETANGTKRAVLKISYSKEK